MSGPQENYSMDFAQLPVHEVQPSGLGDMAPIVSARKNCFSIIEGGKGDDIADIVDYSDAKTGQQRLLADMIEKDGLPKYVVSKKTNVHKAFAGEIIPVIPRHFNRIYREVGRRFGLEISSGQVIGITGGHNRKPVILNISELKIFGADSENTYRFPDCEKDDLAKLCIENEYLVEKFIGYAFCNSNSDFKAELKSEGRLALLKAAETFIHSQGVQFSTYAYSIIRNRLTRFAQDHCNTVRESNFIQEMRWKYSRFEAEYRSAHKGKSPGIKEIAVHFDISHERAEKLKAMIKTRTRFISIDKTFSEGIKDLNNGTEKMIDNEALVRALRECKKIILNNHPGPDGRNWPVFLMRHGITGDGKSTEILEFSEIANMFGVSKQAVESSLNKAMKKSQKELAKAMGIVGLIDYSS